MPSDDERQAAQQRLLSMSLLQRIAIVIGGTAIGAGAAAAGQYLVGGGVTVGTVVIGVAVFGFLAYHYLVVPARAMRGGR